MKTNRIQPVILCGGAGSRLWPLSRESYPKQFLSLDLDNKESLLQKTILRINSLEDIEKPVIICNESNRFIVAEQLRSIGVDPKTIILEPIGKGTAPAIALSALYFSKENSEKILLILSSDHEIKDINSFSKSIKSAQEYAEKGRLVTFGTIPHYPETAYGYIESKEPLDKKEYKGSSIIKFIEKPDIMTAQEIFKNRKFSWNSGIFLFKIETILKELNKFEPKIIKYCSESLQRIERDLDFQRINKDCFKKCPNISIDVAIMERTSLGTVIPLNAGWSDIGSWDKVWEVSRKNSKGNSISGKTILKNSHNCLVRGSDRLIVGIGIKDLVIIETDDAILILDKNHSQYVKNIVQELKKDNRREGVIHKKTFRPWGSYYSIIENKNWQVKKIIVKPNQSLSLQKHNFRSEHWVVVEGSATVEINDNIKILEKNESAYIPLGAKHRLSNDSDIDLVLIEVQSGEKISEEDIIRFKDQYGRIN